MASVYTRTGDKGTTGLYTGERVNKDSLRVEAYGTIDELDSVLGLCRATAKNDRVKEVVYHVQKYLWLVMADIASIGKPANVTDEHTAELEKIIDEFDEKLEPLNEFLVPGDNLSSAYLDFARTVARRGERSLWRLSREEEIHEETIRFLNRLSDLCFIMMRTEREL